MVQGVFMKHQIFKRAAAAAAACSVLFGTAGIMPELSQAEPFTVSAADIAIEDFSLSDITMTDSYCTNAFDKELEYLLSFDTNRLLCGFRENAKMNTYGAKRYGGWENTLIAGHSVGHYLSAVALAYQNPSLTDAERKSLSDKMDALLTGMRVFQ